MAIPLGVQARQHGLTPAEARTIAHDTTTLLIERFPAVFDWKNRRPLAIGIRDQIQAALPDVPPAHLQFALTYYVHHINYQRALAAGGARFGLDGNPAGEVTADQAARAKSEVAALKKRLDARKSKIPDTPPPESSATAPPVGPNGRPILTLRKRPAA